MEIVAADLFSIIICSFARVYVSKRSFIVAVKDKLVETASHSSREVQNPTPIFHDSFDSISAAESYSVLAFIPILSVPS